MADSGEEKGLFGQINKFLKGEYIENRDQDELNGDETKVLDLIGDLDLEPDSHFEDPKKFAKEIASQKAEIVAILELDSLEKLELFEAVLDDLETSRFENIKERYGVELVREVPYNSKLPVITVKYKGKTFKNSLGLVVHPDSYRGQPGEHEADELRELPGEVREEIKDYTYWYTEEGKYRSQTGIFLDAAKKSGLVSEEQAKIITKARDEGKEIITNIKPLATKTRFGPPRDPQEMDYDEEEWDTIPGEKYVWAIAPGGKI